MNIKLSKKFRKQYEKADLKIRKAFDKRLELFLTNPSDPLLNKHSLTGNFNRYYSINITGDWRALYVEEGSIIIFELLGTHSKLYR